MGAYCNHVPLMLNEQIQHHAMFNQILLGPHRFCPPLIIQTYKLIALNGRIGHLLEAEKSRPLNFLSRRLFGRGIIAINSLFTII